MKIYEIFIIIGIVAFVGVIFGIRIYKIIKHKPLDECSCCKNKSKKMLKKYHKLYGKN